MIEHCQHDSHDLKDSPILHMVRPPVKARSSGIATASASTLPKSSSASSASSSQQHFSTSNTFASSLDAAAAAAAAVDNNQDLVMLMSDQATEALIRRTLCSHQPPQPLGSDSEPASIHELLPPLTSSNEVDLQLYAFVAILIKEFVNPWYSKITSDHVFVDDVVLTIAHCTRALEERMRGLDWERILLSGFPELLDAHVIAYRTAESIARGANSASVQPDVISRRRQIYHTLRSHPALSPVPEEDNPSMGQQLQENDFMYRQMLAQGMMTALLPTEDLQNPCLFSLVSGTLADLVLGEFLAKKFCQNEFLYDMIQKAAEACQAQLQIKSWAFDRTIPTPPKHRLVQLGLISQRKAKRLGDSSSSSNRTYGQLFWIFIHYVVLAYAVLRFCISGLLAYSSLPLRTHPSSVADTNRKSKDHEQSLPHKHAGRDTKTRDSPYIDASINTPPVISYHIWQVVQRILLLNIRMPWLCGLASLFHQILTNGPGRLGRTDGPIDRFVSYHLLQPLRTPTAYLPNILRVLRNTLFPNNAIPASSNVAFPGITTPRSVLSSSSLLPAVAAERDPPPSSASASPVLPPPPPSPPPPTVGGATAAAGEEEKEEEAEARAVSPTHPNPVSATTTTINANGESSSENNQKNKKKRAAAIAILNVLPRPIARMYLCPRRPLYALIPSSLLRSPPSRRRRSRNSVDDEDGDGEEHDERENELELEELEVMITAIEESILNLIEDEYLNRHLLYSLLEYLVAAILPELGRDKGRGGSKSVRELLTERGVLDWLDYS